MVAILLYCYRDDDSSPLFHIYGRPSDGRIYAIWRPFLLGIISVIPPWILLILVSKDSSKSGL